jgi:hypothetical protein
MEKEHTLPTYVHGEIVSIVPTPICDDWCWVTTTESKLPYLLTWQEVGIERIELEAA